MYGGYEQTIWNFAGLHLSIDDALHQITASFTEIETKKKLHFLMDALLDIEGDMIKATTDVPIKEKVKRFFNTKTFGTFEQFRVEMQLRYKAQQVFLTSQDKLKIHGYWVPCVQATQDENDDISIR